MKPTQPIALAANEGKTMTVLGSPYIIKVPGADTGGAFSLVENVVPPQSGVPPHVHHRELEIFYILEGALDMECGGKKFTATKGATVTLPKDVPHSYTNPGDTPARLLVLIQPAGFERFFEEVSQLPPGPPDLAKLAVIGKKYGLEFVPSAS